MWSATPFFFRSDWFRIMRFPERPAVLISKETSGPAVDSRLMTSVDGIFACGNVLHVHDLVDYVSEESRRCGAFVCDYLEKKKADFQYAVCSRKQPQICDTQ